jgi:hypothetical protein
MSGRKVCLNFPSVYYTGREQSPLHFGLSAEGYEINSIMEGFDKELWIVEVRNNKKVWTKKEHINKMTYEIPLINEFTDTNTVKADTEIEEVVATAVESNSKNNTNNTNKVVSTDISSINADTDANAAKPVNAANAAKPVNAANAANAAKPANNTGDDDTNDNMDTSNTSKIKAKVSKTIKPTDYTLFITYRIHQMKEESSDNKKNYDCARYEWKEYKKKPEELRLIMVEANNFQKQTAK